MPIKKTSAFLFLVSFIINSNIDLYSQGVHPISGSPATFGSSLRTTTTFGIFDIDGDDWLKLTDRPQELSSVEGFQIHSLLSNITTGNDNFASNRSGDDKFAFGLIGKTSLIPKITFGLAVARSATSDDLLYGPGFDGAWGSRGIDDDGDGFVDNYSERGFGDDIFGDRSEIHETLTDVRGWDSNFDGIDDLTSTNIAKADVTGKDNFSNTNFILAGGMKLNNALKVGISYTYDSDLIKSETIEEYSLTPSTNTPNSLEDIGWDDTQTSTDFRVFDENSRSDNTLAFGVQYNLRPKITLDGKLTLNKYSRTDMSIWDRNTYIDYNPNGVGGDAANNNRTFGILSNSETNISGIQIGIWSKVDYAYNEKTQLLGFFDIRLLPGSYEIISKTNSDVLYNNPDRELNWHETMTSNFEFTDKMSGDLSGTFINLAGHYITRLEQNVLFGMGVQLRRTSQSLDITGSYEQTDTDTWSANETTFQTVLGSPEGNQTSTIEFDTKEGQKITITSISFPVSAELTIREGFIARIGAQYVQTSLSEETSDFELAPFTTTSIRLYDDPVFDDFNETTVDSDSKEISHVSQSKNSRTDFRFGFGWKVNKNANLDFAGIAKLTDLTDWRLSLTIAL